MEFKRELFVMPKKIRVGSNALITIQVLATMIVHHWQIHYRNIPINYIIVYIHIRAIL